MFCLYGIRQPRDWTISFGQGPSTAVFPRTGYSHGGTLTGFGSTGCSHDETHTDFLVQDLASAGLPGRDAAATGLDGTFCSGFGHRGNKMGGMQPQRDSTDCFGRGPSGTPAAAEPAGGATGRPSDPADPTPTDSWPEASAAASPAVGAASSLAAGAATSLATASLVFLLNVGQGRVCRLLGARTSLGSPISRLQPGVSLTDFFFMEPTF